MPDTPLNKDAVAAATMAVISDELGYIETMSGSEHVARLAVSAYLSALPAQPDTVTSVEELDALPMHSYVQGNDGFKHAKDWNGGWHLIVNRPSSAPHLSGSIELPATVLYRPEPSDGR